MGLRDVFILEEENQNMAWFRGKPPKLLSVEEFKALYAANKIRGAGLYELGRKQAYYIDVPKGHFQYHRPWVMT